MKKGWKIALGVVAAAFAFTAVRGVVDPEGVARDRQEREAKQAARAESRKAAADQEAAEEAAKLAAEKAKKNDGLHCLSEWDGSSRPFARAVKEQLRDPSSFEHIETRIAPRNAKGEHGVYMKYRARNGFGGMNVGIAAGSVNGESCDVVTVDLNED